MSEESSEAEDEPAASIAKATAAGSKPSGRQKMQPVVHEESNDDGIPCEEESSGDSSDGSPDEDDSPAKRALAKQAPAKDVQAKKNAECSDEDSSDDSSDENEPPVKKAAVGEGGEKQTAGKNTKDKETAAVKPAPRVKKSKPSNLSSDDDSTDDDRKEGPAKLMSTQKMASSCHQGRRVEQ